MALGGSELRDLGRGLRRLRSTFAKRHVDSCGEERVSSVCECYLRALIFIEEV